MRKARLRKYRKAIMRTRPPQDHGVEALAIAVDCERIANAIQAAGYLVGYRTNVQLAGHPIQTLSVWQPGVDTPVHLALGRSRGEAFQLAWEWLHSLDRTVEHTTGPDAVQEALDRTQEAMTAEGVAAVLEQTDLPAMFDSLMTYIRKTTTILNRLAEGSASASEAHAMADTMHAEGKAVVDAVVRAIGYSPEELESLSRMDTSSPPANFSLN